MSPKTAEVTVKIADLPWFKGFLDRLEEFVHEYAWHDRTCAAVDADGDWHAGNPDCTCGYSAAIAELIGGRP